MIEIDTAKKISDGLIKEWKTLWEESSFKTFFNSYAWFSICLKVFKYRQILIITIRKNQKLIGILPLIKKGKYFLSPGEQYLDNTTLLIKNIDILESLIVFIKNNNYHVILKEVEYTIANEIVTIKEFASANPRANLNTEIENIIKHKELRYLKRIMQKNEKDISFEIYKGKECYKNIKRIFEIEKNSSKPKKKKDIFGNEDARELFTNIAKTENTLLIILKNNNIDIAHLFCVIYGEIVMAYHMAYNSKYSKLQPGKLIFIKTMEYIKLNNYKTLDFSRGNSTIKRHMSNESITKFNIYINCGFLKKLKVVIHNIEFKIKNTRIYNKIKLLIKRK